MHFRELGERDFSTGERRVGPSARSTQEVRRKSFRIIEQALEKVLGGELLVAVAKGDAGWLGLVCAFVEETKTIGSARAAADRVGAIGLEILA